MSWYSNPIQAFLDLIIPVGEYTQEFFENIGQAVAGYLGAFFEPILHNAIDFFVSLIYFGKYIFSIFENLFTPITYIFYFLKQVVVDLTAPVAYNNSIQFSADTINLFNQVPMFSTLMSVLGGILCLFTIFALIKILAK